jgi:hypothetical protein
MFYSLVDLQFYEEYVHELNIFSRKPEEECVHAFFKEVGTRQLTWALDPSLLPQAPAGFGYIPIPNGSGTCMRIILD